MGRATALWICALSTLAIAGFVGLATRLRVQDRLLVLFTYVIALATVASVFQEHVRSWFWRPSLEVSVRPIPPDCHKTQSYRQTPTNAGPLTVTVDAYYFRLRVTNSGTAAARDVEVYVESVEEQRGDLWRPYERFTPQWLPWVGLRDMPGALSTRLPVIPRAATRCVDLAYIVDPAVLPLDIERLPGFCEDERYLVLAVVPQYLRRGHLLPRGTYRVTFSAGAANHEPRSFTVVIQYRGWCTDEAAMFKEGVIVHPVARAENHPNLATT
jgi:hypothetical protein